VQGAHHILGPFGADSDLRRWGLRLAERAKVVFAINLFTTLSQVIFQVPQIRRLLDLVGHSLCFLNQFVKFLAQSSVEGFAGNGLF